MAKKGTSRKPKTRQGEFEGMESPSIAELDSAIVAQQEIVGRRVELTNEETEANKTVNDLLVKHKLTFYKVDGVATATLSTGEAKLKIKKIKVPKEED